MRGTLWQCAKLTVLMNWLALGGQRATTPFDLQPCHRGQQYWWNVSFATGEHHQFRRLGLRNVSHANQHEIVVGELELLLGYVPNHQSFTFLIKSAAADDQLIFRLLEALQLTLQVIFCF